MAGWDHDNIMGSTPTLTTAGSSGSGMGGGSASAPAPHHGPIGIVIVAVLGLFFLDKAGFKFAVSVGKR